MKYVLHNGLFLLFLATGSILAPQSLTAGSRRINVQGKLTNAAGTALSGGQTVTFKLYTASSGGSAAWNSGTLSVTPSTGGLFNVSLGTGTPDLDTLTFDRAYFLGITVGADSEMTPRQELGTAVMALGSSGDFIIGSGKVLNLSSSDNSVSAQIKNPSTASRQIAFLAGDAPYGEKLRVDGVGHVGIGSDTPGFRLHVVASSGTADVAEFKSTGTVSRVYLNATGGRKWALESASGVFNVVDSTAGATRMSISTSGLVGVGTTSPTRRVHIHSESTDSQLAISSAAPSISLTNAAGNPGANSQTLLLAMATANGHYGLNSGDATLALIGNSRGNLVLNSNYAGTGVKNIILQPSGGIVAIGTTTPSARFDVVSSSISADTQLAKIGTKGGSSAGIGFLTIGSESPGGYIGWDFTNNGLSINAHTAGASVGGIFIKRIDNGHANIGIGTTNPSVRLAVVGDVSASGVFYESDRNLKKNIHTLPADTLDRTLLLNGVSYQWDIQAFKNRYLETRTSSLSAELLDGFTAPISTGPQIGLIAQEVEAQFPALVHTDPRGVKAVDYGKFSAILLEALKAQQKQIEALKARVEALEK